MIVDQVASRTTTLSARMHYIVSSAGSSTGHGILKSLVGAFSSAEFTAIDSNPAYLVAAARSLPVRFQTVPLAESPEYVSRLLETLRHDCMNVLIPVHDLEIGVIASMGSVGNAVILAPSAEAVANCNDKWLTYRKLEDAGIPTPTTVLPHALLALPDRYVNWLRKPRRGVGSQGVAVLRTRADIDAAAAVRDVLIQEACSSPELTLDAFVSRVSDYSFTACRERLQVKAGVCTKARLFLDDFFDGLTRRISEALGLRGAFCYQVMRLPSGEWGVTDINPRHGGGTTMWLTLGINFPAANVADALGASPQVWLPTVDGDHYVVRHFEEVLTR